MRGTKIAVVLLVLAFALNSCGGGGGPFQLDGLYFGLGGDEDYGIVGGTDGRVATTTDGGITFTRVNISFDISKTKGSQAAKTLLPIPPTPLVTIDWDITDVKFMDGWTGIIVGDKGGMIRTSDAGNSWQEIDLGISTKLWGLEWDLNLNATYTFGEEGKVFFSGDDGVTWTPQITPNLNIIYGGCFLNGQSGWLVGEDGLFLGTSDGGTNWNEITPKDLNGDTIDLSGLRLRDCWWGNNLNGAIVGEGGTFLHTENDGANWDRIDLGVTAEFRKIDFTLDGSLGFMVGDPYIGRSLDWGKTWYAVPLSPGEELALAIKNLVIRIEKAWGIGEEDMLYRCDNLLNDASDPEPPICIGTKITF